jgi:hypothetical protein
MGIYSQIRGELHKEIMIIKTEFISILRNKTQIRSIQIQSQESQKRKEFTTLVLTKMNLPLSIYVVMMVVVE